MGQHKSDCHLAAPGQQSVIAWRKHSGASCPKMSVKTKRQGKGKMSASILFVCLNVLGTFVFGLSGAMVGIRRRLDIFGILVLAVATGVAGGIIRDLLLGSVPPEVLHTYWPMAVASLAGVCAFFFQPQIERFKRPVMRLDAVGFGVFVAHPFVALALVCGLCGLGHVARLGRWLGCVCCCRMQQSHRIWFGPTRGSPFGCDDSHRRGNAARYDGGRSSQSAA